MSTIEEEIETLELEFEEVMYQSTTEHLQTFAQGIPLDEKYWKDKRKTQIMKALRKNIESAGGDDETKLLEILKSSISALKTMQKDNPDVKVKKEKGDDFEDTKSGDVKPKPTELLNSQTSVLRRDFVIVGKLGDTSNEKDIGYLGIVRQMEEGIEKGYKEHEVVASVLKAIVPKSLRTYLGMTKDLNIPKLSQVLRIHYKEKAATELYQELITMRQEKNEDATAFVVRALETREKILFASKEEGAVQYEKKQVQKLFLSTIESGIEEEIAGSIRPFLLKTEIEDVDLMHQVNLAQSKLKIRKQKLEPSVNKKVGKVASVGAEESSEILKTLKEMKSSLASVGDLKKQVEDLQGEITALKRSQSTGHQLRSRGNTKGRRKEQRLPKCENCQ